jgi:hypothetical protein
VNTRCASALLALLVLGAAASGQAHTRSASYSSWQVDGLEARVRVRLPLLELTRLPPELLPETPDPMATYLATHLLLLSADGPCEVQGDPVRRRAPEGWAVIEWTVRCAAAPEALESQVLIEVAPSHLHFARLHAGEGGVLERVLTGGDPRWSLRADTGEESEAAGTSIGGYVLLGIGHILTGWDHLAFIAGLLLLAVTLREVTVLVTSFTLAHSVTLGLAVLGVVHPEADAVEALIGFSIALVAFENVWLMTGRGLGLPLLATAALSALTGLALFGWGAVPPAALAGTTLFTACHFALLRRSERPARLRAAVAFGFGLVHGFGFAGILAEMSLPNDRLVPALFGFNVGVELGQLAVVALVWPALALLARRPDPRPHRWIAELGSAAIAALGLFWFASRTFS